jgi:hypothetical protein
MNQIHKLHQFFPKIHFNIIMLLKSRYSEWSLTFRVSNRKSYNYFSFPSCALHASPVPSLYERFNANLWSSSLCNYVRSSFRWSQLSPNILLSSLFSNTLSLYPSFNVRDQVSHPYRTSGQNYICIAYMYLSLRFWCQSERQVSDKDGSKNFRKFISP